VGRRRSVAVVGAPPAFHEEVDARTHRYPQSSTNPARGESSCTLKASDSASPDFVGRFDFSHSARRVVPSQTQPVVFPGTIKELFLFAAVVYSTFTFMFRRIPPRLEEGLGVGYR
jgi:hypothetical protein